MAPLGYDTNDRKIAVNKAEADRVRAFFRGYLKLGSINLLIADLRKQGIVTKVRALKSGVAVGGIPFTRGPLAHLLRNRFYIGKVAFKGEILSGEQPAIVDRTLFDAVQAKLDEQLNNHAATRTESQSLLAGRIFDDRGNRMSPSLTSKQGIKYRYYLSSPLLNGDVKRAGSILRAPAAEIEALVVHTAREHLNPSEQIDDRSLVNTHVLRVEVQPHHLLTRLAQAKKSKDRQATNTGVLQVSWHKTLSPRRREIFLPDNIQPRDVGPIRSETRATLIASIARGRRWLDELIADPTVTIEIIAKREHCSIRKINMTISLAFLAPDLVKAAIEGRLPQEMGIDSLCDLPAEWSRQPHILGFNFQ